MRENRILRTLKKSNLIFNPIFSFNFREAVIRCFCLGRNRGKSGHLRAEFPVKAGGAYLKMSSRLVQQKVNRLVYKVRVKRWGKSSPPRGQLSGRCKPNSMQGEIGNRVARSKVSGTPHLHKRRINAN
jgi:hypothetical protein